MCERQSPELCFSSCMPGDVPTDHLEYVSQFHANFLGISRKWAFIKGVGIEGSRVEVYKGPSTFPSFDRNG